MITICVKPEVFFVAGPMGAERATLRADSEEFPQAASRAGQTGIDCCQLPKRRASKHRVQAVQQAEMGGLTPSSEVMAGTLAAYVRVGRFDV
jgi:hypothetical protein